jgi:hypothetical protein
MHLEALTSNVMVANRRPGCSMGRYAVGFRQNYPLGRRLAAWQCGLPLVSANQDIPRSLDVLLRS